MSRALRAQLNQVITAMTTHGASIPKPLLTALAERARLDTLAADYRQPRADHVADLMAAALLAGNDPFDIDEVRQLGLQASLASQGMETRIAEAGDRILLAAITGCATDVVSAIKVTADTAGETLRAAHLTLGGVDLADSAGILQLGTAGAQAFVDARTCLKVVDDLNGAWFSLATATRIASPDTPAVLRMSDAPLAVFEALPHRCTAWQIVVAGGVIDLADFTNASTRVARIQTERVERDAAQPTFEDAYRQQRGHGAVLS